MESVQPVQMNTYQSNNYKKDLSWLHFDNEPMVQERKRERERESESERQRERERERERGGEGQGASEGPTDQHFLAYPTIPSSN